MNIVKKEIMDEDLTKLFKFDKRIVDRMLYNQLITQEDFDKHLETLDECKEFEVIEHGE